MSEIESTIKSQIATHDVVLYMKGNKQFPMCGFSGVVVQILNNLGAEFETVDVLQDPDIREGIKAYSDWPTLPQLYVKGEFIGGCDIIREMFEDGELKDLLESRGIITK